MVTGSTYRRVGFALMASTFLIAALLQWKGLLYTRADAPKVTSQIEYTKPDGTIVRSTAIRSRPAGVNWVAAAPIAALFAAGAALVAFTKR